VIPRFLLKKYMRGEMPRKKGNKEFLIAGYRRIAMDKNASLTQLKALDRLAVMTGYLEVKFREPERRQADDVCETPVTDVEVDESVERFLAYKRQGGDHAATNSDSPSGQSESGSDRSTG
jgi:hypothetical protein